MSDDEGPLAEFGRLDCGIQKPGAKQDGFEPSFCDEALIAGKTQAGRRKAEAKRVIFNFRIDGFSVRPQVLENTVSDRFILDMC